MALEKKHIDWLESEAARVVKETESESDALEYIDDCMFDFGQEFGGEEMFKHEKDAETQLRKRIKHHSALER